MSDPFLPCQVFLGGSCNPTTWRERIAIPMLKERGISFYNPQVTHWDDSLVEVEYKAKESASLVFIVLDRHTRNVASMVEAAYLAGCRRRLVLVMDEYTGPGQLINGEPLSVIEYEELMSGFSTVRQLVERERIPVFNDLTHALTCTVKMLREDLYPQDLGMADDVTPVPKQHPFKYPQQQQLTSDIIKLHDIFLNSEQDHITLDEAQLAYKIITNKELTNDELQTIAAVKKDMDSQDLNGAQLPLSDVSISFEEFCGFIAELRNSTQHSDTQHKTPLWHTHTQAHTHMHAHTAVSGWPIPHRPVRSISNSSNSSSNSSSSCSSNNSDSGSSSSSNSSSSSSNHISTTTSPTTTTTTATTTTTTTSNNNSSSSIGSSSSRSSSSSSSSSSSRNSSSSSSSSSSGIGSSSSSSGSSINSSSSSKRDIYLGGTIGDEGGRWREEVAIPHLNKNRVSYFTPTALNISSSSSSSSSSLNSSSSSSLTLEPSLSSSFLAVESVLMANCHVLLFVISSTTRGVSAMAHASHYIGLGRNVVLCVQMLSEGSLVDGEKLSSLALKDYNRGRSYLSDQAKKEGIPVFCELIQALECAIAKSQDTTTHT